MDQIFPEIGIIIFCEGFKNRSLKIPNMIRDYLTREHPQAIWPTQLSKEVYTLPFIFIESGWALGGMASLGPRAGKCGNKIVFKEWIERSPGDV